MMILKKSIALVEDLKNAPHVRPLLIDVEVLITSIVHIAIKNFVGCVEKIGLYIKIIPVVHIINPKKILILIK